MRNRIFNGSIRGSLLIFLTLFGINGSQCLIGAETVRVETSLELVSREAFRKLKSLTGQWKGKTKSGRQFQVSYHVIANDSVLVESWTLGPGKEALTLYHMDGSKLMATHYCPQGNQPRLDFVPGTISNEFIFEFVGSTNLAHLEDLHQKRFEINIESPNLFTRSETYRERGKEETDSVEYTRVN